MVHQLMLARIALDNLEAAIMNDSTAIADRAARLQRPRTDYENQEMARHNDFLNELEHLRDRIDAVLTDAIR